MVDPHEDVPAGLGDVGDAGRGAVATVSQQQIAGSHRDTPEGLAPVGVGDLEEVALQILQADAEVDPPVGPEAAGPADRRGVDRADAVAVGQRRGGVTLPKLVGHPAQPLLSGSKSLEQCHRRDVTPTGLLGVRGRFLEGTAASQMDQQGSQQHSGVGKASGAAQRTQRVSLLLPTRRQELTHQLPVIKLLNAYIGVHPHNSTDPRPDRQALS